MAQAAARKRTSPAPAGYARGRSENLLPPLRVRYYRQMKPQRVYQVTVGWQSSKIRPSAEVEPIRVRLLMAGAQVVPSEQVLDPANPDASATFYVTPLARGRLRGEHLEVLMQGRKVQEINLPTRVVTQRRTLVLFVLALLVPWLLLNYVRPPEVSQLQYYQAADFVLDRGVDADGKRDDNSDDFYHLPKYATDSMPELPKHLENVSFYTVASVQALHNFGKDHPIELYWLGAMLLLTLGSWWSRRPKRKRRVGKPIPLPRPAEY